MYANLLEANVVDTWVNSGNFIHLDKAVPVLDAVATCDEAMKQWSLVLVNRQPDTPERCRVLVGGQELQGLHRVTLLSGDSADAYNDLASPDRVTPSQAELVFERGEVELPPHSVTVIQTIEQ
jgi:alpha-N-arabinofuranosidase